MNKKTLLMLRQLMDGRPRKLGWLANELEISARLIRYRMGEANDFLTREGFPALQYSRNSGMSLVLDQEQRDRLERKLTSLDTYDYVMTSEERQQVMTLMLLHSGNQQLTSQYFADQLGVSKSSIDKDIALLKNSLFGTGVWLESKAGKGSLLAGDERELRHYGVRLLEQHMDFAALCQGREGSADMVERWAKLLYCEEDFPALLNLVRAVEREVLGKQLAYDSIRMVLLTLAVTLVRVRAGMLVQAEPANLSLAKTAKEYVYAVELAQRLETRFGVVMPGGEVYMLAVLLAGAKYVTPEPYLKGDWANIQLLLDQLIRSMSEELGIDFTRDEELCDALQTHLGPMVFRLSHGISVGNPNLREIKENYAVYFSALEKVLDKLDSELLHGITEDDVAYLVLHFCASIERGKRMPPVSRVAIVCVHGAGTANLLRELVRFKFKNIRVVTTVTYTDMQALEHMDVDFVIASISLAGCPLPWVKVETIPTAEDWEAIHQMILKYGSRMRSGNMGAEFFKEVMEAVQAYCDIRDVESLTADLYACFEANGFPVRPDRLQPSLSQLLESRKIRCRQRAGDWEEAVRQACGILVETGDATEEFTQSAIQSVRSSGPYIVIMPGVALVHGEPGKGVIRLAMSFVTFEDGVCFHHPNNDPVRLVLCLAPMDNWSHIQALRGVLELLDRVSLQMLCEANSPKELMKYLKGSGE